MAGGTLKIRFDKSVEDRDHEIYVGSVTSISNTVQKRGSAYPVVTQGVQNSFPIENGNSQSYTFNFTHHNGQNGQTNAEWMADMESAIDRWQARTDGCKLIYTPDSGNAYIEDMVLEGYIKSLNTTYKNDYNEIITGTLSFSIGRMYVNEGEVPSGAENYGNMFIMMSDSSQTNWYMIYSGNGNDRYACVDSVEITAGPESPFEFATIKMSRKKLFEQVPELQGDIIDHRNKIFMNILGIHDMFVHECPSSGDTITITAYCNAQIYRLGVLNNAYVGTPDNILDSILKDRTLGMSFAEVNIKKRYNPNQTMDTIVLPKGTSVYRALQICAKLLKARLFFADNCAWIVDYTMNPSSSETPSGMMDIFNAGGIILRGGQKLNGMVMGESTCDDQGGFEPVKNYCTVEYAVKDESGKTKTDKKGIEDEGALSVTKFEKQNYGTIDLHELSITAATRFAQNHLAYLREPQRAIKFTLKENYGKVGKLGKSWKSYFSPCAVALSFEDDYNSEKVDNRSVLYNGRAYHKLALSQYTRSFPQGTCEYTFGLIASVELSDNLSQTNTSLNS